MKNYVKPMSTLVAMSMEENIATSGMTGEGGQLLWTVGGLISGFEELVYDQIPGTTNNEKLKKLAELYWQTDGSQWGQYQGCFLVGPLN